MFYLCKFELDIFREKSMRLYISVIKFGFCYKLCGGEEIILNHLQCLVSPFVMVITGLT